MSHRKPRWSRKHYIKVSVTPDASSRCRGRGGRGPVRGCPVLLPGTPLRKPVPRQGEEAVSLELPLGLSSDLIRLEELSLVLHKEEEKSSSKTIITNSDFKTLKCYEKQDGGPFFKSDPRADGVGRWLIAKFSLELLFTLTRFHFSSVLLVLMYFFFFSVWRRSGW